MIRITLLLHRRPTEEIRMRTAGGDPNNPSRHGGDPNATAQSGNQTQTGGDPNNRRLEERQLQRLLEVRIRVMPKLEELLELLLHQLLLYPLL